MTHQFNSPPSVENLGPSNQSGTSYVNFSADGGNNYTLVTSLADPNYQAVVACYRRIPAVNPTPTPGTGTTVLNVSVPNDGETVIWDIGYRRGLAWAQTQGGDVYAQGDMVSQLPAGIVPRAFNLNDAGGYPGVVIYGSSNATPYDFSIEPPPDYGINNVSSRNWLARRLLASPSNLYSQFYQNLSAPTTEDSFANYNAITKPASRASAYYVKRDMQTSGNWSVGNGETIVFLVDGDLTINGRITITGTGFAAFIVSGDITVTSAVGDVVSSVTPILEGIYITNGIFSSGATAGAATAKLIGRGMFIAGNFALQRDFTSLGQNASYPGELFIYNPQLLFTMPEWMKEVPITWSEVAP